MTPNESRLRTIAQFGWSCEYPAATHPIQGIDKKHRDCVWCEGMLYGVSRAIYLGVEDGHVMLIGEMRDVSFSEFVGMLDGTDVEQVVGVKQERQRELF